MRVPSPGRRRSAVLAAGLACAVAVSVHAKPRAEAGSSPVRPAAGLDDAGYLALADRLQRRLDPLWDARMGRYEPGPGATDAQVNADLLLVHAVAARRGHHGPARQDARARSVARFLVSPALFAPHPPFGADPQVKGAGWVAGPGRRQRHPVFDVEVIEALTQAYLAREALRLDARTVGRIRDEVHQVATSEDYRYPALRLNQINWYSAVLAADAAVNGTEQAFAAGLAGHLAHFLAGAAPQARAAGNLGAGLRFHYLPHREIARRANVDSAEYANIVLSVSRYYGAARDAGMERPAQLGLLRDWVRRVVAGYWTHGGYLNWDTGLSFSRWHQRKKVGLAQQALIGVAAERELQPGPAWGGWAKWMLDRGLLAYDALAAREHGIPPSAAYGVDQIPSDRPIAFLAAARVEANAIRALQAGLGRRIASRPPALYAYDPDTGRLAVTTPAYNTAIVAVNQRTIPYGGLDLARLFDANEEVAANLGGSGRAAFGLHVRGGLSTQYGDRRYEPGVTPLRLTRAPLGVRADASERRAYAGAFRDLRAVGEVERDGVRARTAYRFTPRYIEARWTLRAARRVDATVTFPSWGRGAHVDARLRDGRTVRLGRGALGLAGVAWLHVFSARAGYRIVPRSSRSVVRLVDVRPQPSDPNPGRTVEVRVARGRTATFAARLLVDA